MSGLLIEPRNFRHFGPRGIFYRLLAYTVVIVCLADSSRSQSCVPTDCITSQWTDWTECTQSCGTSGLRERKRTILSPESCGGTCSGKVIESEPCNVRCCAENCDFTAWTSWTSCRCSSNVCSDPSPWSVCVRYRDKVKNATCGGYCDNIIFQTQCNKPCCYKDCIMGR
ncbi:spondin-1 [Biomphalaria glabrata]|nr:spondin-1 [Biomphalaria glabrata]